MWPPKKHFRALRGYFSGYFSFPNGKFSACFVSQDRRIAHCGSLETTFVLILLLKRQ